MSDNVLAALTAELEALRLAGHESVGIEPLLDLIAVLRAGAHSDQAELARKTAQAQLEIEAYKGREAEWADDRAFQHDSSLEVFRSVIASGATANRTALAINGGGAIALLAFLGHLAANATPAALMGTVTPSLQWFVLGTLAAAASAGATNLTQFCYNHGASVNWNRCGNVATVIAITVWITSVVSFGVGAMSASAALASFG